VPRLEFLAHLAKQFEARRLLSLEQRSWQQATGRSQLLVFEDGGTPSGE
jgi:hypothetical protein